MDPLALALVILCAWSQPHCQTAAGLHVSQEPLVIVGALSEYDHPRRAIRISPAAQHPAVITSLLAHETTNAQGDWRGGLLHCVDNEAAAYAAAFQEWSWFSATFGPPRLTEGNDVAYGQWVYMGAAGHAHDSGIFACAHARP